MYHPWEVHAVEEFLADTDDDDDEDYHPPEQDVVVKQEVEDTNMTGTSHLPMEYQAVMAAGYDKDALMQQALATCQAEEDAAFPDL
jgi:hypothetical protein